MKKKADEKEIKRAVKAFEDWLRENMVSGDSMDVRFSPKVFIANKKKTS